MATLNNDELKRRRKKRFIFWLITCGILLVIAPLIGEILDKTMIGLFREFGNFEYTFNYRECLTLLLMQRQRQALVLVLYLGLALAIYISNSTVQPNIVKVETIEVAHGIFTPVPVGNGQYGTARFMTSQEMEKEFPVTEYTGGNKIKGLFPGAGIIVDYQKVGNKEFIRYLAEAVNVEILGATRCGKTRRLLMTSTWLGIMAGINMLVIDVKGEIFAYTHPFAEKVEYEVRVLDFRYPEKSMHFNNLSKIVELLREGSVSEAVDQAWDIVTILVGETKGEKIWTDGQCATIAAAILIVAQDAPENCKNLTNVYYFLAYMCEPDPETGEMPINEYLENLPANHPARGAFQIAKIAPFRTRSSFFTSALATLRLYTAWNVADVTKKSDYTLDDTDDKKVIYYLIFPDEKTTYHPIGAIFIKQLYESLVKQSLKKGGKLDRRFIFRADEIGNFPIIPGLGTMLSAGAGRNIFFELVWQDYQQEESKYKDDYRNIRTNCQLTICLKVTDPQTTKQISERLGNYTVEVNSASSSQSEGRDGRNSTSSYTSSANMGGRPLLFPSEISDIEKPDALILYGGKKGITNLPDISEYYANEIFGMGDEEFNKKLFLERMEQRPSREIGAPILWGIWEEYGMENREEGLEDEEKVSFL